MPYYEDNGSKCNDANDYVISSSSKYISAPDLSMSKDDSGAN
jgi:hypothetical protein